MNINAAVVKFVYLYVHAMPYTQEARIVLFMNKIAIWIVEIAKAYVLVMQFT